MSCLMYFSNLLGNLMWSKHFEVAAEQGHKKSRSCPLLLHEVIVQEVGCIHTCQLSRSKGFNAFAFLNVRKWQILTQHALWQFGSVKWGPQRKHIGGRGHSTLPRLGDGSAEGKCSLRIRRSPSPTLAKTPWRKYNVPTAGRPYMAQAEVAARTASLKSSSKVRPVSTQRCKSKAARKASASLSLPLKGLIPDTSSLQRQHSHRKCQSLSRVSCRILAEDSKDPTSR